jgi:protein CpxP
LHDLYFGMLKTDNPDKNKVDSVATLIGAKRKELATATFEHFQQLRAICRDDQKKLFDATIDDIARMVTGPHPPDGPPH